MGRRGTYFAAVDPGCGTEAERVAHGVDEDEDDADDVGGLADVVGIRERKGAIDLSVLACFIILRKIF